MAAQQAVRAIFRAAEEGDTEVITRILDGNPWLLSVKCQRTLLMTVASRGHIHAARLLLERGQRLTLVMTRDTRPCTMLHLLGKRRWCRSLSAEARTSARGTVRVGRHSCMPVFGVARLWYGSFSSKRESVGWMREMRTVARL